MPNAHPLPGSDLVVFPELAAGSTGPLRLHVVRHGAGASRVPGTDGGGPTSAGVPVLLLHGPGTSAYLWRDVARDLSFSHACIAPDLAGLGASERPRALGAYRPAAQAHILLALLDALGLDRVAVAGHDLGGSIAVQLAAIAPRRVAALVLVSAPVHRDAWPVPAALPFLLPGAGARYAELVGTLPALAARTARSLTGGRGADGVAATALHLAGLHRRDGWRGVAHFLRAVDGPALQAAWDHVREAPPHLLVLWGDDDPIRHPSYGRRLAREVPDAVWVPVSGAGHLLPAERPERVAEEIAGFLAEIPTGP